MKTCKHKKICPLCEGIKAIDFTGEAVGNIRGDSLTEENKRALLNGETLEDVRIFISAENLKMNQVKRIRS